MTPWYCPTVTPALATRWAAARRRTRRARRLMVPAENDVNTIDSKMPTAAGSPSGFGSVCRHDAHLTGCEFAGCASLPTASQARFAPSRSRKVNLGARVRQVVVDVRARGGRAEPLLVGLDAHERADVLVVVDVATADAWVFFARDAGRHRVEIRPLLERGRQARLSRHVEALGALDDAFPADAPLNSGSRLASSTRAGFSSTAPSGCRSSGG